MSFDLQPELGNEEQQHDQEQQVQVQEQAVAEQPSGFATLGLAAEILKSVTEAGYAEPTDVQLRAIPAAISGADLMVSSRTGSGTTAAFVLPALQRIIEARRDPSKKRERGAPNGPRILVLAPTRELAMQVSRACQVYGRNVQGLRVATIVGGVPYAAQLKALRGPLDILIATPGRLLDHLGSGKAMLGLVEMLVLDEADRMLDMGFIDDIHAIANEMSKERQTVMFSATFDGHVGNLAQQLTHDAQRIRMSAPTEQHAQIEQRLHWADNRTHRDALLDQLLTDRDIDQAVVFTSTQRDADELADRLQQIGHHAAALHGAMPQGRRNRVLGALRMRQLRILIATDVAARGIDVPTISHVINYGLPMKAEDYVHRIGRTGRAGRNGIAITLAERRDIPMIRRIERFTTHVIPVSVVAGLEPRLAPPVAPRAGGGGGGFRDDRQSRGGYGPRPGFGAPRNHGGDRDRGHFGGEQRGPGGNFRNDGPRPEFRGDAPRHDARRDAPRGDFRPDAPRGDQRQDGPRGDYRGQRPEARTPFQGGAAREGGDRPAFAKPQGERSWGDKPRSAAPFGGERRNGPSSAPRSGPRDPRNRTR